MNIQISEYDYYTNTFLDIHSYNFFDSNTFIIRSCHYFDTNMFKYSFVSIFRTQTHSEDVFIDFLWILYFAYGYFVDINDQKCYLDCKSTELVPVLSRV